MRRRVRESPGESTAELLLLLRGGDRRAKDALFARYLVPLRRWARGRLPAGARGMLETDDLVQDAVLRTLDRVARFEPEHSGAFGAYLRRGVLNRIRDELRRRARRPLADGTVSRAVDPRPSPVEEAIGHQQLASYEAALARLGEPDQEAITARLELGFSYREVAEILGKPSPDAARMAVTRALRRLAREMAH